jgi:phosphate/phosphite/phosphonate ABC transporter binding protein
MLQLQPFCGHFDTEAGKAGEVFTWTVDARDKAYCDRNGDLTADLPTDPKKVINPSTLIFSYTPVEDPAVYQKVWDGFIKNMEKTTGKKVAFFPVQSNAAQYEAMRSGRLHVAGVNAGGNALAVNCAGFVPFAMMAALDNSFGYEMEIIVPADSSIKTPADLKGKKVAFTAPTSNSGFKAPSAILKSKFGMEAERDFKPAFSGKHDNSIIGVANKDYDAARKIPEFQDAVSRGAAKGVGQVASTLGHGWDALTGGYMHGALEKPLAKLDAATETHGMGEKVGAVIVPLEALVEREPVTVLCSEKGWIRAVKGHNIAAAEQKYKEGDGPRFAVLAETTDRLVIFGSNGRFYTIGVERLPGGRGQGEPLRLMIDLPNEHDVVALFPHRPGLRLLVAADDGRGFIVDGEEALAQTRAGAGRGGAHRRAAGPTGAPCAPQRGGHRNGRDGGLRPPRRAPGGVDDRV